MASLTSHFGLQKLDTGDSFSDNGQKYTTTDRDTIDRLLYLGASGHHHTGDTASDETPTGAPSTAVDTTTGFFPGSTTVTYAYTFLGPDGTETAPSPSTAVNLPGQTQSPNPPAVLGVPGTGTLQGGGYYYELSAYTGTINSNETAASSPAYCTLSATGSVVITLPALPSGASGFNVYRKGPGGANYLYITSIDMTAATPPGTWTDDGSIEDDCNRFAPTANTTQATNAITVTIPAAPPTGWTWNLYRTLDATNWASSFLINVSGNDINGDPIVAYEDLGYTAGAGQPPAASTAVPAPSQIELTDGAEVQGTLPPGLVASFPLTVTFAFPGQLAAQSGRTVWVCEYPEALIVSVRAALGRGSTPNSQPVIVDVLTGTGTAPSYSSVFGGGTHPSVPVGQQIGAAVAPPATTNLHLGDSLSVDIVQSGGGTNTDSDLTLTITMLVSGSALPAVSALA